LILASLALAAEPAPNLVLVSVDGLRADRVGAYGAAPSPTPMIDRLAAEGLVCDLALSQSNESLFSHASLLTGRHPSEIAPPDYRSFSLPPGALLLPEILRVYGYATGGFVAGGHVKGVYGFDQGFDAWSDEDDFGAFFHTVPKALDWLDHLGPGPFFLFLHGYDTHRPYLHANLFYHPFDADYSGDIDRVLDYSETERVYQGVYYPDFPLEYFWHAAAAERILDPGGYGRLRQWAATHTGRRLTPEDVAHIRAHYDSGALSADMQVGRFVDALQARGEWERTLLVVVSDHGEDLGEHGLYNHRSTLVDSATRVPTILAGGALPPALRGTRIPGPCQALDILPTFLKAAGAVPPPGLRGRDLLAGAAPPEFVVQEGVLPMMAVRTATHRLVVQGIPLATPLVELLIRAAPITAPTFELYDLRVDPGEHTNVLDEQRDVAMALRAALLGWLEQREAVAGGAGAPALDPAFREALRSRGYW
jgi:arylsulfatase A-like enzyme